MPRPKKTQETLLLHRAINKKAITKLESILERQYENIEAVDECGRTPLLLAIEKDFDTGFNLLLERDANVNACDNERNTALHYAVTLLNNEELVKALISRGAHLDAVNRARETPLTLSMVHGYDFDLGGGIIFELLVKSGASLNVTARNGNTPLHFVLCHVPQHFHSDYYSEEWMTYSNEFMLHVISLCSSDVNKQNNKKETPLHLALKFGVDVMIVRALLENGASVDIKDVSNKTPLHMIPEYSPSDVIQEMLAWGARVPPQCECNQKGGVAYEDHITLEYKKYYVMCQTLGLHAISYDYDLYELELLKLKKLCQEEVDKMKSMKYGNFSVHSLFSHMNDPPLALVSNAELVKIIMTLPCDSQFPMYASLLYKTYRDMRERPFLLNEAQHELNVPLPPEMRRQILYFLNNKDLNNFISACKTPKIMSPTEKNYNKKKFANQDKKRK